MRLRSFRTFFFCLCLVYTGCSSTLAREELIAEPPVPVLTTGEQAVAAAEQMVGKPYRRSGVTPAGFDCSGLVRYSYLSAGLDLPHQTRELKRLARVVDPADLRKGDLLFFTERGRKYSHVGIYAGDNLFVHAARTGKSVRIDSLLDPYWQEHFLDARRVPLDPVVQD